MDQGIRKASIPAKAAKDQCSSRVGGDGERTCRCGDEKGLHNGEEALESGTTSVNVGWNEIANVWDNDEATIYYMPLIQSLSLVVYIHYTNRRPTADRSLGGY